MSPEEKAKFARALTKMQRKGLIAVALCIIVGAGIGLGFLYDPDARKVNPMVAIVVVGFFFGAGVWAFRNNFVALPARFRRLMTALETPENVRSVRVWVVAANQAVANTPVAQWCVNVELRDETITLNPGVRQQAEELAAIIRAHAPHLAA